MQEHFAAEVGDAVMQQDGPQPRRRISLVWSEGNHRAGFAHALVAASMPEQTDRYFMAVLRPSW